MRLYEKIGENKRFLHRHDSLCRNRGGKMQRLNSTPRYTMSVAARLSGIAAHMLRSYEREGVLTPGRLGTRNRLFSDSDLAQARHIAELAGQGINMAGIKAILRMEQEESQK
jgi:hypothetical protein